MSDDTGVLVERPVRCYECGSVVNMDHAILWEPSTSRIRHIGCQPRGIRTGDTPP